MTLVAALLLCASVYGCGGGGGGNSAPAAATVSGIAATGAPMSGSAFLKDSANSPEMSTTINAQTGAFSFDVSGKTPPFMLRAGSLYSMGGGSGTANINPLSNLMVADMGGFTNMSSLNSFYRNPDSTRLHAMFGNMSSARLHLRDKLHPLLTDYHVPDADPIRGSFSIGHDMDQMFDDVKLTIDANGNVTMVYVNGTHVFDGHMGDIMGGTMISGNVQPPGTVTTSSSVTITPTIAKLQVGQTQQFTANVQVTWSVSDHDGGSITADGVYTASSHPGMFLIKATSASDPSQTAAVTVLVGNLGMMM